MIRISVVVGAVSLTLLGPAAAQGPGPAFGVYGPKGNDTGGIIPWSPDNEQMASMIAQENCGFYNKYALPNSIHRVPGDYITYKCVWEPPGENNKYRYIKR